MFENKKQNNIPVYKRILLSYHREMATKHVNSGIGTVRMRSMQRLAASIIIRTLYQFSCSWGRR